MKSAEYYWSVEYHEYAIMKRDEAIENERKVKEALEMAERESAQQRDDSVHTPGGSDLLVTSDSNSTSSIDSGSMVLDSDQCNNSVLGGTIHSSSTTPDSVNICIEENASKNKE